MRRLTLACAGLFFASLVSAQEVSHFSFSLGTGFTEPVGNAGRNLDVGWNIGAGAGVNFNQELGAMVHVNYNRLGINSGTLNAVGFPGGNVSVLSATLDPVIHFTPRAHFDAYITGGGGLYHWMQDFTAPTTTAFTAFDPFFGFYTAAVPTTAVISSYSVNKWGYNLGAGVAFGSKWHGKFFAEARYNRVFLNNNIQGDYIPVTFGFRW